jgi:hypothetical protein
MASAVERQLDSIIDLLTEQNALLQNLISLATPPTQEEADAATVAQMERLLTNKQVALSIAGANMEAHQTLKTASDTKKQ